VTSASVWFPDAFEGVPEAAIERLTRTSRPADGLAGACCLWTWLGDLAAPCPHCTQPGALLVGHTGLYSLARHNVVTAPDRDVEHQALWTPHTCKETRP